MIKLLIVDDEAEIRKGIKNKIQWEENGVIVCGEAENGLEAIEMINRLHPDILLVDIRMPVMNGLELIEYISSYNPDIKSVILSGHDDFSYAQKALKLGARDYLLKPCMPAQILETVLKVKAEIESFNTTREMLDKMKVQLNEALPLLKEKLLTRLVKGEINDLQYIREKFELFKVNLDVKNAAVALIRMDEMQLIAKNYGSEDIELMKFAIKNIIEEILSGIIKCEVFENNDDVAVMLNTGNSAEIMPFLNKIKDSIKNKLGLCVSVGIGNSYEDLENVHLSYIEAVKAVETRFFLGEDIVVCYSDIQDMDKEESPYPIKEEKIILDSLSSGNIDKLEANLNRFFDNLLSGTYSKGSHIKSALALHLSLYHYCIEKGINTDEVFGQGFSRLDELLKLNSLERLKTMLLNDIKSIVEYSAAKKKSNMLVDLAVKYIDKNYSADLSLETVAKEVFITPTYLSFLFKQCLGISFVDYLNKTRITKSCELLKDLRMKTYEISSSVGYKDEKYFSFVFKKYMGITPTQYREQLHP